MEPTPDLNSNKSNKLNSICTICSKTFSTKKNLLNHELTFHLKKYPFICAFPNCSKAYSISSRLKVHMHTHTNNKPYHCNECNKSFSEKGYLKTHMKFHLPDRPFACLFCNKTYKTKGHLKDHILVQHKGIKKYECIICKKRFGRSSTLHSHSRTHSGEKIIACPMEACEHFSFEKSNMENQYKRHLKQLLIPRTDIIELEQHQERQQELDLYSKVNTDSPNYQKVTRPCSNDTLFNRCIEKMKPKIFIVEKNCKKINDNKVNKNGDNKNDNDYENDPLISYYRGDLMQNRKNNTNQMNNNQGNNNGNHYLNQFHQSEYDDENEGKNSFLSAFL